MCTRLSFSFFSVYVSSVDLQALCPQLFFEVQV